MSKMWAGRTSAQTAKIADDFNSSIRFDKRMYKEDITGSIAHAYMLAKQNIISKEEADILAQGLESILEDIETSKLEIDLNCEDIHMFIEQELTSRIGDTGKKLHTARSRNDQVALDVRLYLRDEIKEIQTLVYDLVDALCAMAKEAKRVLAKEAEVESEKYAFRCFLLRLGFIGNDSKAARKILLRNLSGHSAFRNKAEEEKFRANQKAKRDAAKAERLAAAAEEAVTEAASEEPEEVPVCE